jgi:hypothetical protein
MADGSVTFDEHRVLQRTRVSLRAKIIVPRDPPVVDCTVQDITGAGACLKLAATSGLPERFDLTLDGRTHRHCRVVWRTAGKFGVSFEHDRHAA